MYAMEACGQTDGVLIALDTNQKVNFVTEYIRNQCKYLTCNLTCQMTLIKTKKWEMK